MKECVFVYTESLDLKLQLIDDSCLVSRTPEGSRKKSENQTSVLYEPGEVNNVSFSRFTKQSQHLSFFICFLAVWNK